MRFHRCAFLKLVFPTLLVPLLAAGCGGGVIREVNSAAITARVSYTDDASRKVAQKSLALLADRATDYRVGPEDQLEISVFEWELRNETRTEFPRVSERGAITLPMFGELQVNGLSVDQVRALLEKRLVDAGILQSPRVSVSVKEFRSKRVAVVGAVTDPGVYTLRRNATTLLEVLTLAGGVTEKAGQSLYVIRASPAEAAPAEGASKTISVDLYELLEAGDWELNLVLQNGDIINVPEARKVFVVGFVREPGGFPLTRPTTVLDAVAMAKGLRDRDASPSLCMLKRQTPTGELLVPLDLVAISRGRAPNLFLIPNDIIDVRQTAVRHVGLEILDAFKSVFSIGYTLNR